MIKKGLVVLAVSASMLSISSVALAKESPSSSPLSQISVVSQSNNNVVVVQRAAIPGADMTVMPTKNSLGHADTGALHAVLNSTYFNELKNDVDAGKVVVLMGNGDGKLTDLLMRQAFDPNHQGPVVLDHNMNDPLDHVVAKGIAKIPGETAFSIFTVYGSGKETPNEISQLMYSQYQTAVKVIQNDTASTSTNSSMAISPNSNPIPSGGSYYYFSGQKPVNETNGLTAGTYQWGYNAHRVTSNGTNFSLWDCQREDSVTPGAIGSIPGYNADTWSYINAVWQSMGVMQQGTNTPWPNENVVDFGPASQNSGPASFSVTLSKDGATLNYQYQLTNGATEYNRSVTSDYGAWSIGWPNPGSNQSATLTPVVRATNTSGSMIFSGDFVATFVVNMIPQQTYSTGDIGDEFILPDL